MKSAEEKRKGADPLVSVVVAVHNHVERLPVLFDSILSQSFKALEVVVVDDASTEGGHKELVDAYRDKGLRARLHAPAKRLWTKDARLCGVRHAQGEIIAFADADDAFAGGDILERHVDLFRASGCDALHFRTARLHGETRGTSYNSWADPFARELRGRAVFAEYARTLAGHVMWNKLYSRDLWMRHMDAAEAVPIAVCSEDLFLSTLYLFHARHYVGSDLVGYAHGYADKIAVKSACRAAAFFVMIRDFLPYLEARGCPPEALAHMTRHLHRGCRDYAGRACLEAAREAGGSATPYDASTTFADLPPALLAELLLFANAESAEHLTRIARMFA
jgi:CDP-glycerol glycerophosphotransferase